MPRMRFSPAAGTHSVSSIAFSASWRSVWLPLLGMPLSGLVHGDEPLRRVAEDDRLLRAPGVRILVLEAAARDERAGVGQRLDDGVVGVALVALLVEHALALEARRVLGQHAVGVDGERDRRVDAALLQLGAARHPDVVVVGAVAGRGVHEAGAGVVGDVIAVEQGHVEVVAERRAADARRLAPPELSAVNVAHASRMLRPSQPSSRLARACRRGRSLSPTLAQLPSGAAVDLVKAVVDLRRERDGAVAGDRPRRRRPDDD